MAVSPFTLLFCIFLPLSSQTLLITLNTTLLSSPNKTFTLAFISTISSPVPPLYYLSIYYTSLPSRTVVWTANRSSPSPVPFACLCSGHLSISDPPVWISDNSVLAVEARLLDTGNLQLVSSTGDVVWESFNYPTDTWLPGMFVTRSHELTSWNSVSDPSPGLFSLRMRPLNYAEFELVFNGSVSYWSTGNWTGTRFANVPEMTVPYIYRFEFNDPFGPNASFSYWIAYEMAELAGYGSSVLTRFVVEPSGQFVQYTWQPQEGSWSAFWSRPDNLCQVYGQCGPFGVCNSSNELVCDCPNGFRPLDRIAWDSGNFSKGCFNGGQNKTGSDLEFEEIGAVDFVGDIREKIEGVNMSSCEGLCRSNCSCFGMSYDFSSRTCFNLFGNAYNLRKDTNRPVLYLKILRNSMSDGPAKRKWNNAVMASVICSSLVAFVLIIMIIFFLLRRKLILLNKNGDTKDDNGNFDHVKAFSLKELSIATKDFSEQIGHGSFGAVFHGELPNFTQVAVKRLERAGTCDKEFRTEVRTLGIVHHVNLVRLLGFCSEGTHRLLVYDLMPLGPLSAHLGSSVPPLNWAIRVKIAIGTARALAYLHEGCRECIIHCDIKPDNILLDSDYTPKVSDFGLANLIHRDLSRVVTTMRGTWGYVAPEWISGTAITSKADVYSYGMTLLEILGGRRNADVASSSGDNWVFYPAWAANRIVEGDVADVLDPRLSETGGFDLSEAERMGKVAVWCIQDEESSRPTMSGVVKMLEGTMFVSKPPRPRLLEALVAQGESFQRKSGCTDSGSVGSDLNPERTELDVDGISEIS